MNVEDADQLMQALEAKTRVQWDALLSHASYKALYSFHYCTGRIFRDNGADVYLDDREVFVRDPISAHLEPPVGFSSSWLRYIQTTGNRWANKRRKRLPYDSCSFG